MATPIVTTAINQAQLPAPMCTGRPSISARRQYTTPISPPTTRTRPARALHRHSHLSGDQVPRTLVAPPTPCQMRDPHRTLIDHRATEPFPCLTVSVGCLRAWCIRGEGPPAIRVGSCLRWDEREVDAWLNARRESGGLAC